MPSESSLPVRLRRAIGVVVSRVAVTLPGTWLLLLGIATLAGHTVAAEPRKPDRVDLIWQGLAPGETVAFPGEAIAPKPEEVPPATRIRGITEPHIRWYFPAGTGEARPAVLIFPGGAYNYVVVDKEGSEVAEWFNQQGIAAGVVLYRTKRVTAGGSGEQAKVTAKEPAPTDPALPPDSSRPWQDAQRSVRWTRAHAETLRIDPTKIGVVGFSAGGLTAALAATRFQIPAVPPTDETDSVSARPDFCMLFYPWRLASDTTGELSAALPIGAATPPTFLVHTHDDRTTSLSSVAFYRALVSQKIPAELHIFQTGGHGYGIRPVENSEVDTWPALAEIWLRGRKLIP